MGQDYTFTTKELEDALTKLQSLEKDFPGFPLVNIMGYELWDESNFPLTLRKVGENTDVTVRCEDYFGGEEGGDHAMYIILSVGYGEAKRYFRMTGLYDSWDSSEWDGSLQEVVSKEVKKTEWVAK